MAEIVIWDGVSVGGNLQIRDDSPLAKAKLTQLFSVGRELLANLSNALDQIDVRSFSLGVGDETPNLLDGTSTFTMGGGLGGEISITKAADKLLFADDGFSPVIPVTPGEAWVGIEFDLRGQSSGGASVEGLGVNFEGTSKLSCASYLLFGAQGAVLPSLREAAAKALSAYTISVSKEAIHAQEVGTVNVAELSGSISLRVSLEQPLTLNPLASASLPLNLNIALQPTATAKINGEVQLSGDFIVRCQKLSVMRVRLGVYKKQGSTISVTLTAAAGLSGSVNDTDVLSLLLNAALPGVDVTAAGIKGDAAQTLNAVVKDGLDRSLTAQVNATCSAAFTHEAAVLYDIQLDQGDVQRTDEAIGQALRGDWSGLNILPNARLLRNIVKDTIEKRQAITLNLFGLFSARSVIDYVKTCTIMVDESGQLSFIDKLDTSRISASSDPMRSDTEKLRQALMEDFVCTATYLVIAGRLNLSLTAVQSYFDYGRSMSREEMRQNFCVAYALGLVSAGALDPVLASTQTFRHAAVTATIRYDMDAALSIFYKDPTDRTAWTRAELESDGRSTMRAFLSPTDDTDEIRLSVLGNDAAWAAMDDNGNVQAFHSIPYLSHLGPTQLSAVGGDWTSIVWWAKTVTKVAPALDAVLKALEGLSGDDPSKDAAFMSTRTNLANVLGEVTRKTDAAFVHGWGAAVLFGLSGKRGHATLDITWDSKSLNFHS